MAKRPEALPVFAIGVGAEIVAPPSGALQSGFVAGQRPPSAWANWLHHVNGQAIEFLMGPSPSNWTRYTPGFTPKAVAVDDATPDGDDRRLRILAILSGALYASRHGESWVAQTANPVGAFSNANDILFTGTRFVFCTSSATYWSLPDGVAGSAIMASGWATPWTAATGIAGALRLAAGEVVGSTKYFVSVGTGGAGIKYSTDGMAWTDATLSGALTGIAQWVTWTGQAWVAVTDDRKIVRATTAAGTWTTLGLTLPVAAGSWKVASDGAGTVVAYRIAESTAVDWYVSTDHGATWAAQAAPSMTYVLNLQWVNGSWWLSGYHAPYLMQANTIAAAAWTTAETPYLESDTDQRNLYVVQAQNALLTFGVNRLLISHRGTALAPGPWSPTPGPSKLFDAAYLRGVPIAITAPTDGQLLGYDVGTGEWTPADPPSGAVPEGGVLPAGSAAWLGKLFWVNAGALKGLWRSNGTVWELVAGTGSDTLTAGVGPLADRPTAAAGVGTFWWATDVVPASSALTFSEGTSWRTVPTVGEQSLAIAAAGAGSTAVVTINNAAGPPTTNLIARWKADDLAAGSIASWPQNALTAAESGRTITPVGTAPTCVASVVNGHKVARFTTAGTSAKSLAFASSVAGPFILIVVYKMRTRGAGGIGDRPFDARTHAKALVESSNPGAGVGTRLLYNGGAFAYGTEDLGYPNFVCGTFVFNGSSSIIRKNGVTLATGGTATATTLDGVTLGAAGDGSGSADVDIAEILCYSGSTIPTSAEAYCATEYAL